MSGTDTTAKIMTVRCGARILLLLSVFLIALPGCTTPGGEASPKLGREEGTKTPVRQARQLENPSGPAGEADNPSYRQVSTTSTSKKPEAKGAPQENERGNRSRRDRDASAEPASAANMAAPVPVYPQAVEVGTVMPDHSGHSPVPPPGFVMPPAEPFVRQGVACIDSRPGRESKWKAERPIPWQVFAQGEYIGPPRLPHVPQYRLRVDDFLEFVYRLTGETTPTPYRLNVGDTINIESLTAPVLDREVLVQPDGTITARHLGQVPAAGRTLEELRRDLEERYREFVREPTITVTPVRMNTTLQELRATVDARFGPGGQTREARVTPEGTVQLPGIGSVPAQGLSLDELQAEIEYRYAQLVDGVEVTPILARRAPRFIYVVGEVGTPGRFELEGPTTVMQAIAMAGSWNIGAYLNHVVVLRRDDQWRLMATRLKLHDAFFGKRPCPADEIWLRDSDVVIVPKHPVQWTGDLIEMIFTRGVYGVVPMFYTVNFSKLSTI